MYRKSLKKQRPQRLAGPSIFCVRVSRRSADLLSRHGFRFDACETYIAGLTSHKHHKCEEKKSVDRICLEYVLLEFHGNRLSHKKQNASFCHNDTPTPEMRQRQWLISLYIDVFRMELRGFYMLDTGSFNL